MSDEVDGFLRLAKSDEHLPVNIGNPNEFTILECAQLILKVDRIEEPHPARSRFRKMIPAAPSGYYQGSPAAGMGTDD